MILNIINIKLLIMNKEIYASKKFGRRWTGAEN